MPGLKADEIEARSMAIIDELLPPGDWSPGERAVVKRLVHTSGDPSLAASVRFSAGAVEAAAAALRSGASVFTDTHMVRIGVNESRVEAYGGALECLIADQAIVEESRRTGRTRAACAMRAFGRRLDGAVVAVGNAPTALREVLAWPPRAWRGRLWSSACRSASSTPPSRRRRSWMPIFRSWRSRARAAGVRWPPPR